MSDSRPPTALRALRLIVGLAARRWIARFSAGRRRGLFKRAGPPVRTATPRKARSGGLLLILVAVMILPSSFLQGWQLVRRVVDAESSQMVVDYTAFEAIASAERSADTSDARTREIITRAMPAASSEEVEAVLLKFESEGSAGFRREWDHSDWPSAGNEAWIQNFLAFLLLYISIMTLLMSLGSPNREMGSSQWDMEWLWSMPVAARALFASKLLESALLNLWIWFTVPAVSFAIFRISGFGITAAITLAALTACCLAVFVASVAVFLETWLRTRNRQLKNFQAICSVFGLLMFFSLFFLISQPTLPAMVRGLGSVPHFWNPLGLPVLLTSQSALIAGLAGLAMLAWLVLLPAVSLAICGRMVRSGLQAQANVRTGERGKPKVHARSGSTGLLRGVVAKDLRLLLRDRNLFVQSLLLPLIIIGFQLLVNHGLAASLVGDAGNLAAFAFAVSCYVFMFCAMPVLAIEGKALWMFFTFPQPLQRVMSAKVRLWAVVGAVYAAGVIGIGLALGAKGDAQDVGRMLLVLACVPIYAYIAAGLGVHATDPLEQEVRRRIGPGPTYLYMMTVAAMGYALASGSLWQAFVQAAFAALLALALWQKLRDRLPYLLDPLERPPARISMSDGLIAAMAFFTLQILVTVLAVMFGASMGMAILISFTTAGLVVALIALVLLARAKTENLYLIVGMERGKEAGVPSLARSAGAGLLTGIAAGAVGLAWLFMLERVPMLRAWRDGAAAQNMDTHLAWLLPLGVLAAPLFEEFIFRGLLFRGMERAFGSGRAILASAAVFAMVHPPISFVPVFALGLGAAWVFRRQGVLLAPILAHASYNALVILL